MGLALLMASCETMENRDELGPVLTKDQLSIAVVQPTSGSNTVILQNKTQGAIMYWDWGTGTSHRAIDTIYIPFAGTFKLKYTAFCAGGTITDSTNFTIAANDDAFLQRSGMERFNQWRLRSDMGDGSWYTWRDNCWQRT